MFRTARFALPGLALALAAVALAQPKQPEPTPEEKLARELMTAKVGLAATVVLPGGATATEFEAFEKKFDARVSATLYDRAGTVLKVLPDSGPVFAVNTIKFQDGRTAQRYQTLFVADQKPTGGKAAPATAE